MSSNANGVLDKTSVSSEGTEPEITEQRLVDASSRQDSGAVDHLNLAHFLYDHNRLSEAEQEFRKAAEQGDADADTYLELGRYLEEANQLEEAESAYRSAINQKNATVETHLALGRFLSRCEKFADAETVFRDATQLDDAGAAAYLALGNVCEQRAQYAEAERAFREATKQADADLHTYAFLGWFLFGQDKPEDAERAFRDATRLPGAGAQAYQVLANFLVARDKPEAAEHVFREATKQADANADTYLNFGWFLFGQEKFTDAEKAFTEATQLADSGSAALLALGEFLVARERLEEAEQVFRKATEQADAGSQEFLALSSFLKDKGDFRGAEELLRQATQLPDAGADSHAELARYLQSRNRNSEAEQELRAATEAPDASTYTYLELARHLENEEDYSEAENALNQAVKVASERVHATYENEQSKSQLAGFLLRRERFEEAVPLLQKIISLDPGNSWPYRALGYALEQKKDLVGAENAYKDAVEKFPSDTDLLLEFAAFLQRQTRDSDAEEVYRRAIDAQPDYIFPYFILANFLASSGKFEEAGALAQQAIKKAPNDALGYIARGNVFNYQENYTAAEKAFRMALSFDPDNFTARNNLADLLRRMDFPDSARVEIEKAKEAHPEEWILWSTSAEILIDLADESNNEQLFGRALIEIDKAAQLLNSKGNDLDLGTFMPHLLLQKGYINFKLGKYDLAVDNFRSCLKMRADGPAAQGKPFMRARENLKALSYRIEREKSEQKWPTGTLVYFSMLFGMLSILLRSSSLITGTQLAVLMSLAFAGTFAAVAFPFVQKLKIANLELEKGDPEPSTQVPSRLKLDPGLARGQKASANT